MIDRKEVIEFFDSCAPGWDAASERNDEVINAILDNAGVGPGSRVLDVACGTGVLVPDYLAREAACVRGVDISPEMIRIASSKFPQKNVGFVCGDAMDIAEGGWDAIVVYNAFPHFPDPKGLIAHLSGLLAAGGILTVAHGASREEIDSHHRGAARHVSNGLMPAEDLAEMFSEHLDVTAVISDDRMYQVAGRKKNL